MKKTLAIFSTGLLLLSVSACALLKNKDVRLVDTPPFNIESATYQHWKGGQPGVGGLQVHIQIDKPDVSLDTVYFRQQQGLFKSVKTVSGTRYSAVFTHPRKKMVLHRNPREEYGNSLLPVGKIPFVLHKEEAVIGYTYQGLHAFCKVKLLPKKNDQHLPE